MAVLNNQYFQTSRSLIESVTVQQRFLHFKLMHLRQHRTQTLEVIIAVFMTFRIVHVVYNAMILHLRQFQSFELHYAKSELYQGDLLGFDDQLNAVVKLQYVRVSVCRFRYSVKLLEVRNRKDAVALQLLADLVKSLAD